MNHLIREITRKKRRLLTILAAVCLGPAVSFADSTVDAGFFPRAVAVNPVTNKIYVANSGSGNVTVIDGADNSTATVAAGTAPFRRRGQPCDEQDLRDQP